MINTLNQSIALPRLIKTQFLSILAISALVLTATFSRADSEGNQSDRNGLAGTWLSNAEPAVPPSLFSFMSDGRVIFSRTITVPTPFGFELVGTGHGEWIWTGNHEFASTMFLLRSGPTVDFTGLVKVTSTFKLNRNSDQLTQIGTVYIFDADGNLLFSFPVPGSGIFRRVTVGQ
jgi:hypothetical protein